MTSFGDFAIAGLVAASGLSNPAPSLANPQPVALVYRTTQQTSVTDNTACTFTAEKYDNNSAFAPSDTKITIPSAGLYRATGSDMTSAGSTGGIINGSLAALDAPSARLAGAGSAFWSSQQTGICDMASGGISYFAGGGTVNHNTSGSYQTFSVEKLDSNTWYCIAKKSANQTSVNTNSIITWDVNTKDICGSGSWHSTSSNNTRLVVPADTGISRVRLSWNLVQTAANSIYKVSKNGSTGVPGMPCQHRWGGGTAYMGAAGPPVNVVAGDYFELVLTGSGASRTVNTNNSTWFQIEQVPAGVKACLVTASSGSIVSTGGNILFPTEEYDDDNMHSTVSNTDRLVVPSGCSYAKIYWYVRTSTNTKIQVQAVGSAAGTVGCGQDTEGSVSGVGASTGVSAWMPCTPGDYFVLYADTGNATIVEAWFALECI